MHRYWMILLLSCWCAASRPLAAQTFLTSTAYEAGQPVYAMAGGEIDPGHPGQEAAVLLADGSVLQLSCSCGTWTGTLLQSGLSPGPFWGYHPTISIGDVHSGYGGNEIVVGTAGWLAALVRSPEGAWSWQVIRDYTGWVGGAWETRVGDIDPSRPGEEIFHIYEGVLDFSSGTLWEEVDGVWNEQWIFYAEVGMDSAIGEFDAAHPGAEIVVVTEMGPAYKILRPSEPTPDQWPKEMLWDDMDNAGWVVKIADVDPGQPGNEIVFGTRYDNRVMMWGPSSGLQLVYQGRTIGDYRTMYDIAVSDVLPDTAGLEILGADSTGALYLLRRISSSWTGTTLLTSDGGGFYAVIAADLIPERSGNEILVAGQSGRISYLRLPCPADYYRDDDVDQADLNTFLSCVGGPNLPIPMISWSCPSRDYDADGDVDMDDFGRFQRCYSGAGLPASPDCLQN